MHDVDFLVEDCASENIKELKKERTFKGALLISFDNRDTDTMFHLMRYSDSVID
jgi:hypothetical protein